MVSSDISTKAALSASDGPCGQDEILPGLEVREVVVLSMLAVGSRQSNALHISMMVMMMIMMMVMPLGSDAFAGQLPSVDSCSQGWHVPEP
jgi:hypothetical protein